MKMQPFHLKKLILLKPENPKVLNPNPKANLIVKPEPDQTRNFFPNPNPINPNPKAQAKAQPEREEFWTRPINNV